MLPQLAAHRLGPYDAGDYASAVCVRMRLTLFAVVGVSSDWMSHFDTAVACNCVAVLAVYHGV
jgi:hypothetical protein